MILTTINATLLQTLFNNDDITATKAETVIDQAIDLLNVFDAGLDNLTGAAGSKTGTYTSTQKGAIMTLAQQIYSKQYVNPAETSSVNIGPLGTSYGGSSELLRTARVLAGQLVGRSFDRAI